MAAHNTDLIFDERLDLKFKGNRTYIHGTDMYKGVTECFHRRAQSAGFLAELACKMLARRRCILRTALSPHKGECVAHGMWQNDKGSVFFYLTEENSLVRERYEYDEESIVRNAGITHRTISAEHQNAYAAIENIIALTKKLNYHIAPVVNGQWLFAQINLRSALPVHWGAMTIECVRQKANAFSQNRIVIDSKSYGEVRFIVGRP